MKKRKEELQKGLAWVLSVDMGYGHERAAHPLKKIALDQEIIIANNYPGITKKDRRVWKRSRLFYEFISRFKKFPLIGERAFKLYDRLQDIPDFYPRRDLSNPSFELKTIYRLIKRGWLKNLIIKLNSKKIPFVTTFFIPAFVAEEWGFQDEIYCIVTDTDMSRSWVAKESKKSRIKYFAPTQRVVERLKLYGVKEKNIFLTGFPLPKENIYWKGRRILESDIASRIYNLDPSGRFINRYEDTLKRHLGVRNFKNRKNHPLSLTFAVGGAGAQRGIGVKIMDSLKKKIRQGDIRVLLIAGSRNDVYSYFREAIGDCGLKSCFGKGIDILYWPDKNKYFTHFNKALRTTDILWTKPSELSFFAGLGIPVIMAPPIGSQEFFNREWLESVGAGLNQQDPRYVNEWLFDWLESGWLAKAALEGYLYAPKMGTYNIEQILLHKKLRLERPTLVY